MMQNVMLVAMIREALLPEVVAYDECITGRLLRSFDTLNEEISARAIGIRDSTPWKGDPEDFSGADEAAGDAAIDWGMRVAQVQWGVQALFTAGLFHLLEQQLSDLYSYGTHGDDKGKQIRIEQTVEWLRTLGVDVNAFDGWPKINAELRAIANACKHAEGNSAERLRVLRPELFTFPTLRQLGGLRFRRVTRPLAGESIFITEDEFRTFASVVRAFWSWLADRLEGSRR